MLGELYKPKGLARETAQAVLEVKEPYAVNVALGCENDCDYCYGPLCMKMSREQWREMRFPKKHPVELVQKQRDKLPYLPEGVFLSFFTDPLLLVNRVRTEELIDLFLNEWKVPVATSSKVSVSSFSMVKHGMTVVSLDERFWKTYEGNSPSPRYRIEQLSRNDIFYNWFSVEPYPSSAIWKQPIQPLLEELKFADLIVFGKWNYDKRANTEQARKEYAENIHILRDFCKSNHVRLHVKSDTLKFIEGGVKTK